MGKKKGGAPPAKAAKKTTAKKGKGARATRQNRGGATNQPAIDFTQGASFPMYGMGMGMAPLMGGTGGMGGGGFPPFSSPGFGMMPAGMGGMGALGAAGAALNKPVTVKMNAMDALQYNQQQAVRQFEQQQQWFAYCQQQQQRAANPGAATPGALADEEDDDDEEEDESDEVRDTAERALEQQEAQQREKKLKAIAAEKETFIADNIAEYLAKFPSDAKAAFTACENAAAQHVALATPEKSKRKEDEKMAQIIQKATNDAMLKFKADSLKTESPSSIPASTVTPKKGVLSPGSVSGADLIDSAKKITAKAAAKSGSGSTAPDEDEWRTVTRSRLKEKNKKFQNPLPVFRKLLQSAANTRRTPIPAEFKNKAQALCDKVSTLVQYRKPMEFEALIEEFDVYGSRDAPKSVEARVMALIWILAREGIAIDLSAFIAP